MTNEPQIQRRGDLLLEQHANLLRQGTVLVDPTDDGEEPWLMFIATHEVKSGDGQVLSKRLQFVRVNPNGSTSFAGWAPHLDLEPLADSEQSLVKEILDGSWIRADQEQRAVALAANTLVPDHFREVNDRTFHRKALVQNPVTAATTIPATILAHVHRGIPTTGPGHRRPKNRSKCWCHRRYPTSFGHGYHHITLTICRQATTTPTTCRRVIRASRTNSHRA